MKRDSVLSYFGGPVSLTVASSGLFRRRNHDVPKSNLALLAALKVNGTRQPLMTVEGAAGNSWNPPVVDDGLAALHNGDGLPDQCDIEAFPHSRLARQLRMGARKPYTPPVWWLGGSVAVRSVYRFTRSEAVPRNPAYCGKPGEPVNTRGVSVPIVCPCIQLST